MNAGDQTDPGEAPTPDIPGVFRAIFEQAAVGLAQIETASGRCVRINPRCGAILGCSREEMERLGFPALTQPDDPPADRDNMRRLVAGEIREFTTERRLRHRDGRMVWVNLTVSPLWAPGEKPGCHLVVVEDITARKHTEESLVQRVGELAALATHGGAVNSTLALEQTTTAALTGMMNAVQPDLVFLFRREGERLILQEVLPPSARQRLGAMPEHRVGECMCGLAVRAGRTLYSRNIFHDIRCTWEECKQAGLKSFAALPLRNGEDVIGVIGLASDTERDFEQQGEFLEAMAAQVAIALAYARLYDDAQRELARRKQAEQAWQQSEAGNRESALLLEALFDAIPDVIGVQDAHRRIIRYNAAGYRFLGSSPAQVRGKACHELIGRVNPCDVCATTSAVHTKQPSQVEKYVPELGIWLECRSYPVLDTGGEVAYIIEHLRDITERKQAEAALREGEGRLRAVIEQAPFGAHSYELQAGGRLVLTGANQSADRILGVDHAPLIGRSIEEAFPRLCGTPIPDAYRRLAATEGSFEDEQVVYADDRIQGAFAIHAFHTGASRMTVFFRDVTERARAETALRRAEAQYRSLFDNALEGIYQTTPEGAILTANPAMARMLGYASPEELMRERSDVGQHGYVDASKREEFRRLAEAAGIVTGFECEVRRKDGSRLWVSENARAVRDEQGRVTHYDGSMEDITERKRAEDALRCASQRLELIAQMTDAVIGSSSMAEVAQRLAAQVKETFEVDACIIRVLEDNQLALLGAGGVSPEQLAPSLPVFGLAKEILESRRPVVVPDIHSHPLTRDLGQPAPGSFTFVSFAGVPLVAEGEIVGVLGIYATQETRAWTAVDVEHLRIVANHAAVSLSNERLFKTVQTHQNRLEIAVAELKQAEQSLRDSETLYQSLVENLRQSVFRKDRAGRFTFANQRFCDLVGRPLAGLIGQTDSDLFPRELAEKFQRDDQQVMASGGVFEGVESHRTSAREERFVQVVKTPLRDATGQVVGLQGIFWDITERKRAEAEREKLQAQLTQAQKMESVGRLAGGVAHDFNNMLQAILGNAALALQDLPADSPVRECLEEIEQSARRSADLTRQLLAFARKQTIAPKVLDLNDTVAGMLKMLRRLIGEDIELTWTPGASLWPVKVDPSQIDQVLANLCVNARDALGDVGTVTIETTNVTLDDTYVQSHPECVPGDYVMLAVSDTGKGMDVETRSHLFEPFFTTKEQGKGTGLGLATVFGIVKQNLGLISVYSEPGQGAVFKIYFPRAVRASDVTAPERVRRLPRGTETVLLVEDEEQVLKLGRRILKQQGYTVLAAPAPAAALVTAAQHAGPIHLLITDVVMPGMNGRELRRQLVASHPDLKCLFMSGYTADVIAHHGVLEEGVQFLQKPFTVQGLAEKIREALVRG